MVAKFTEFERGLGCDSTVLTTARFCEKGEEQLQEEYRDRFPLTVLKSDSASFFDQAASTKAIIRENVNCAEIVVIHTLWHGLGYHARCACNKSGKPYLVMPHGMLDPYSLGVKKIKKAIYMALIEKNTLFKAKRIIYTTEEEEKLATSSVSGLPEGQIVPLGSEKPPRKKISSLQSIFIKKFPQVEGRNSLLFLSRIHHKKGLDRLLDAFALVFRSNPSLLLVIAGDGEPEYVRNIKRTTQERGLEDAVLFTGMLDGDLKWGAFAVADIFVLPSRQENFAIVVAEAMHMGLPIILTDKVNSWPYVKMAEAGFVLGEDHIVRDLEKSIDWLLNHSEEAKAMGERGRNLACRELVWEKSANLMVDCYREVLNCY